MKNKGTDGLIVLLGCEPEGPNHAIVFNTTLPLPISQVTTTMSLVDATDYFEQEMQERSRVGLARIVRFEHMQTVLGNLNIGTAKLRRIMALSNQKWKSTTSHGFEWVHHNTVDAMTIFQMANRYRTGLDLNAQVVHQRLSVSLPCCLSELVTDHPFLPLKGHVQTENPRSTKFGDLLRFLRRYPNMYKIDPITECVHCV
jgi:hypothetical protein